MILLVHQHVYCCIPILLALLALFAPHNAEGWLPSTSSVFSNRLQQQTQPLFHLRSCRTQRRQETSRKRTDDVVVAVPFTQLQQQPLTAQQRLSSTSISDSDNGGDNNSSISGGNNNSCQDEDEDSFNRVEEDRSPTTVQFMDWLRNEQECEGTDALYIGTCSLTSSSSSSSNNNSNSNSNNNSISNEENGGPTTTTTTILRGLFAKEDFEPGEYICSIPFTSTLLTFDSLQQQQQQQQDDKHPVVGGTDETDEEIQQGLLFLSQFRNTQQQDADGDDDAKRWKPYFDCLPRLRNDDGNDNDDSSHFFDATPDFWSDHLLDNELQIPQFVQDMKHRKQAIAAAARKNLMNDETLLQWACWVVRTRGFSIMKLVQPPSSSSQNSVVVQTRSFLIPFLDMANHGDHDDEPNASIEVIESRDNSIDDESFFALQAIRPIRKHDPVTLSYGTGRETCLDLLSNYGFFTTPATNNPNDQRRLDWTLIVPAWTTSLEQDEELLEQLVSSSSSSRSSSNVEIDATTPAAVETRKAMQTILSLRIHLKRLQQQQQQQQQPITT